MHRKDAVDIKRKATLWAIYEVSEDGLELCRKQVTFRGKPECKMNSTQYLLLKAMYFFSMSYDDFIKNASKSDFVKE